MGLWVRETGENEKIKAFLLALIIVGTEYYCSHLTAARAAHTTAYDKPLKALNVSQGFASSRRQLLLAQPAHGHDEHGGRCVFAWGAK